MPIQRYAIPILSSGRDLLGSAQTGSGKTGAFLIPVIDNMLKNPPKRPFHYSKSFPFALILVPTRELALQIHEEALKLCRGTGLSTAVVYGGVSYQKQVQTLGHGNEELSTEGEHGGTCDVLVGTPGRLADMLEGERLSLSQIRALCIDEADRLLALGFERDLRRILQLADLPPNSKRQTALFSATFPKGKSSAFTVSHCSGCVFFVR